MSLKSNIPLTVLGPDALQLVEVLDHLVSEKDAPIETYRRSFVPVTLTKTSLLRNYLKETGGIETYESMNRKQLEGLVLNAGKICALKGTDQGTILFLEIVTCGTATIDFSQLTWLPNYISLNDPLYGTLGFSSSIPGNSTTEDYSDYGNDISNLPPDGIPYLFLFEDDLASEGTVTVTITGSPFAADIALTQYLEFMLPLLLPSWTPNITLNINFI